MKRYFPSRQSLTLTASAALLAAGLVTAPVLRAQSPSPEPSASPTPSGKSSDDIFDVIKKGADKLQKEAKAQKDLEPQIKLLTERQNEMLKRHIELERHLQTILLKQEEAIQRLDKKVEQLDKECADCKAQAAATPAAAKPLPMTEPATPAPSPTATPAS